MAKYSLRDEDMIAFFTAYECCGQLQIVNESELKEYTEVVCCECKEPVMFRSSNGLWYSSGDKVFM